MSTTTMIMEHPALVHFTISSDYVTGPVKQPSFDLSSISPQKRRAIIHTHHRKKSSGKPNVRHLRRTLGHMAATSELLQEEKELTAKHLRKFSVDEYLQDIEQLAHNWD